MNTSTSAFSIETFCETHGKISRAYFNKLVATGRGPRLMKVGRRVLISVEAAADWRRQMEQQTASNAGYEVTA